MQDRHATAAIIGAGDFIGSAVAARFPRRATQSSRGGATRTSSRRSVEKHRSCGRNWRGGAAWTRRREEEVVRFLRQPDHAAPLEFASSIRGANVNFPILKTTERVFRKVWKMACYAGFLRDAKPRG